MSAASLRAAGRALFAARSRVCAQVRKSSDYKPDAHFKGAHLDEMPVPQGSWRSHYDTMNKNYNMQLVAGIILFTSTVSYIVMSDRFFFNFFLPPLPEEGKK